MNFCLGHLQSPFQFCHICLSAKCQSKYMLLLMTYFRSFIRQTSWLDFINIMRQVKNWVRRITWSKSVSSCEEPTQGLVTKLECSFCCLYTGDLPTAYFSGEIGNVPSIWRLPKPTWTPPKIKILHEIKSKKKMHQTFVSPGQKICITYVTTYSTS